MSAPLLIPEPPLQALPTLAAEVGIDAAIFLQQLFYWSLRAQDEDGWVYKTQAEWVAELPWLSTRTFQRVVNRLRDDGLIETKQPNGVDRKTYYRLIVDALPHAAKVAASYCQSGSMTNNNSENTTEKGSSPKRKKKLSVDRKPVSDSELTLAAAVLQLFNSSAGTALSAEAHLTPIVMRIREHPTYTEEHHRRIIEAVFAGDHWWEGPPGVRIIYGSAGRFEECIEKAKARMKQAKEQATDPNAERRRVEEEFRKAEEEDEGK